MRLNFKIITEYDGTHFAGWQVQPDKTTVQGELERALSMILNQPVKVIGSGRTDAGVHALGQVANFEADTDISPEKLLKALNSIIRTPIAVKGCDVVAHDFHARYKALSKEYHYHILNCESASAVGRDYVWHIKAPLDIERMNQCCAIIEGKHDFKSFEASGSPRVHTVRTIYSAGMEYLNIANNSNYMVTEGGKNQGCDSCLEKRERIVFKIRGDGFLRFMVRNIVGTVVMAGLSRITPDDFRQILEAQDRALASATAPARGLFLIRVNYE